MAKKLVKQVKLQIEAAKATPAPPVGPALGQAGVNIVAFTKEFNERTAKQAGLIIPVVINVYEDRSFDFITKTPPAAVLLKKAAAIPKGSGAPNRDTVAKVGSDKVGETVRITSGAFEDKLGVITELNPEKGTLKLSVEMFNRDTEVEVEFSQVEKAL